MNGFIVGRIVHFVTGQAVHRPAIIVHVWGLQGDVNLVVFSDGLDAGSPPVHLWTGVKYSPEKKPNTWHWMSDDDVIAERGR